MQESQGADADGQLLQGTAPIQVDVIQTTQGTDARQLPQGAGIVCRLIAGMDAYRGGTYQAPMMAISAGLEVTGLL